MFDISKLFTLKGKVAVITGGTGILGQDLTLALAAYGADVVIIGRKSDAGELLAREVNLLGTKGMFIKGDVLNEQDMMRVKSVVLEQFGRMDILVNCAGGNMPGAVISPTQNFFDLDVDAFEKVVALNLTGTVLPCKILCDIMANQKSGVIVNIASMSSFRPITRVVGYSAAKAAVKNFTEWLAVEMAAKFGDGIRVNAIAPGFFLTEQNRKLLTNEDGSFTPRGNDVIKSTPFGRMGEPQELVGTLLWLCSDASRFVTGVTVPVDGGFNVFCGV